MCIDRSKPISSDRFPGEFELNLRTDFGLLACLILNKLMFKKFVLVGLYRF